MSGRSVGSSRDQRLQRRELLAVLSRAYDLSRSNPGRRLRIDGCRGEGEVFDGVVVADILNHRADQLIIVG